MPRLAEIVKMKNNRKALLQKSLDLMVKQLKGMGALKIIVFGSFAKDKVDVDSDLDLFVVMPSTRTGKDGWTSSMIRLTEKSHRTLSSTTMKNSMSCCQRAGFCKASRRETWSIEKLPEEEALRWFTQAKDEFEDADELKKKRTLLPRAFSFSTVVGEGPQGILVPESGVGGSISHAFSWRPCRDGCGDRS